VDLQRGGGRIGRRSVPQLVDQPVARDRTVGVEEEQREQRPLLRTTKRDPAIVLDRLQRTEDPELDRRRRLL
jgi:hypothetical protein